MYGGEVRPCALDGREVVVVVMVAVVVTTAAAADDVAGPLPVKEERESSSFSVFSLAWRRQQ